MSFLYRKFRIYGPKRFLRYVLLELRLRVARAVRDSYSLRGEDVVIDGLLGNKRKGFYVDVGANDPVRFNNTYRFYKRGWQGINIEPNPLSFDKIEKNRSRDVNLKVGVGSSERTLELFKFMPDTLTTFSRRDAEKSRKEGYVLEGREKVEVKRLSAILDRYLSGRRIDFLSVDTEGFDLEVLKSNNWAKYRPRVICVETVENSLSECKFNSRIGDYLESVGYKEHLFNGINSIFVNVGKL